MSTINSQSDLRIICGLFRQLEEDYNTSPYTATLVLRELVAHLMHPDQFYALSPYLQITAGRTLIGLMSFMQDVEDCGITDELTG